MGVTSSCLRAFAKERKLTEVYDEGLTEVNRELSNNPALKKIVVFRFMRYEDVANGLVMSVS